MAGNKQKGMKMNCKNYTWLGKLLKDCHTNRDTLSKLKELLRG